MKSNLGNGGLLRGGDGGLVGFEGVEGSGGDKVGRAGDWIIYNYCFGFVTFRVKEDVLAAKVNMDGAELFERALKVNYALEKRTGVERSGGRSGEQGVEGDRSGGKKTGILKAHDKGKGVVVEQAEYGDGDSEEALKGGWQVVGKRRRGRGGPSGVRGDRATSLSRRFRGPIQKHTGWYGRCLRCLGPGHLARDCRDRPRCWNCSRWGHRSSTCLTGTRRRNLVTSLPKVSPHMEMVVVDRSDEVEVRMRNLGRSVLAIWEGKGSPSISSIVVRLKHRWRGIDFTQVWGLCRGKILLRAPSWAAMELILSEERLFMEGGCIVFRKCGFATGVAKMVGRKVDILLRGVPLVWRTEEVL
ncbi:hypothetical protein QJS10_CPB14g01223 [Acorus calamus]|uniref:CCHC-type domain-containing protein n=1 Tax=Acorus calamus TaxID=4465 RepID=A0AAV9D9W2_ACOCL|nr:hypothetical protein QJS10_CPB14g01223 [Acorus calamus]